MRAEVYGILALSIGCMPWASARGFTAFTGKPGRVVWLFPFKVPRVGQRQRERPRPLLILISVAWRRFPARIQNTSTVGVAQGGNPEKISLL